MTAAISQAESMAVEIRTILMGDAEAAQTGERFANAGVIDGVFDEVTQGPELLVALGKNLMGAREELKASGETAATEPLNSPAFLIAVLGQAVKVKGKQLHRKVEV